MRKKIIVKLPEGMNPTRLLTFKEASEMSGVPLSVFYDKKQRLFRGLQVYELELDSKKKKKNARKFVRADEFIRWANTRIKRVDR